MPIYLYVKTHNKTGLKYLGKTISKDPIRYKGSGLYWRNHINKHGYDVTTEIIKECENQKDIKFWGEFYSNLWNIVESSGWANLKPESGDGGFAPSARIMTAERRFKLRNNNAMKIKSNRDKISNELKGVPKSEQHKKNMFQPMSHSEISEKRKGCNNPRYDHTIYCFYLSSPGVEVYMTQRNFIEAFSLNKGNVSALVHNQKIKYKGWCIKQSSE